MAKKKEMNRTSGTARRLTGRSEGIATKLKYGAPLTGSASGVKSISLKDAGEVLTSGIVTLGKKGLKFAPEGLAMALPIGKLGRAAKALGAAGKAGDVAKAVGAQSIGSRLASKALGEGAGKNKFLQQAGKVARSKSEKVFPRFDAARSGEFRGMTGAEISANLGRRIGPTMGLKTSDIRRFSEATRESTTGFTEFSKGAYKAVKFGPNPVAKAAAKEIARSKMASGKIKETFNAKGLARRFKAQGGK